MAFPDLAAAADRVVQATLGVVATWQSDEWGDALVPGVFDEAYELADPSGAGVESLGPTLSAVRASDLPAHVDDDPDARLIIGEKRYRVVERQPDGMGGLRLLLHRIDLDADE